MKRIAFIAFFFLSACCLLMTFLEREKLELWQVNLRNCLEAKLISLDAWPKGQTFDALYILGGSQSSLVLKFTVAAEIYHQKICKKILFMSNPGINEYSPELKRNLSNNEWTIHAMEKMGIPKKDIKAVFMEQKFFGTLNEAQNIAELALRRKYKKSIIVTAPYHTQRSRLSFEHFLQNSGIQLCTVGSRENVYLKTLMIEWFKLKVYEQLL